MAESPPNFKESLPAPVQAVYKDLRNRAEQLRGSARWFLCFIILILLTGVAAIIFAQVLTRWDVSTAEKIRKEVEKAGIERRLSEIKQEVDRVRNEIKDYYLKPGNIWTSLSPVGLGLNGMHITANGQQGWAVGNKGTLIVTIDGGKTWQARKTHVTADLQSVHFVDTKTGWAVGDFGTVITTTDGGKTWKKQESPWRDTLWSVHFADSKIGWAVGERGKVIATTDGGKTWLKQEGSVPVNLLSVHFADAMTGWAVGERGMVIATPNPHFSPPTRRMDYRV